ncbi:MAG: sigma-70 family RNA polymerase sigma factor [Thomasclavelia sp.]|nr:sigma-70 family RNA polymerase sigma factor [Thomasclavelia sp.]
MDNDKFVTENELKLAIKGDEHVCETIYNKTFNSVYFMAYNFFHDSAIAEDITQNVYIRLFDKLDTVQNIKAFGLWTKRITYNECVRVANKNKIATVDFKEDNTMDIFKDDNPTIDDKINNDLIINTVIDSLNDMSFEMKSVGLLRYVDNFSVKDIAEVLGIPEGTVKSRLNRINIKLKNDLTTKEITPEVMLSNMTLTSIIMTAYRVIMVASDNVNHMEKVHKLLFGGTPLFATISSSIVAKTALSLIALNLTGAVIYENVKITESDQPQTTASISGGTDQIEITPLPTIYDVLYTTTWTNEAIEPKVELSNNNYDKILINDQLVTNIVDNGTYKIDVIKEDKVVASTTITVENIDTHSPTATQSNENDIFYYNISDDLSGVDPSSIQMTRNGIPCNDFNYDEETETLVVTSVKDVTDIIKVYDNAGNLMEITIK